VSFKESILKPIAKLRGGAHLPHSKHTAEKESVVMPAPAVVTIPLKQHIGAECTPTVKKDDKVFVGTVIADSDAPLSVPIHSSVSGTVKDIKKIHQPGGPVNAIVIESDGEMTPDPSLKPHRVKTAKGIVKACRECGLVGLGGAGFPVHIKLEALLKPEIDTLIINCAECEPYITSDYRECMESYDDILKGVYLLRDAFELKKVIIAIEGNKPKAIEKLYEIASDIQDPEDNVKLMCLDTSYPQGAEKMLVYTATGKKIPLGKLPADVGCAVMNITSVATLYRFLKTGMPLVSKRITVDGNAIKNPQNVIAPIGASVQDILDFCGGVDEDVEKILLGGPMMGTAIKDTETVIAKQTNAVLCFKNIKPIRTTPCIRCGRCAAACPMYLAPGAVEHSIDHNFANLENLNVTACIECGSCSYVCPAGRPLTAAMRTGKYELRRLQNAK